MNIYLLLCRYAGQVGYIITNMRNTVEAQIGDTFCHERSPVQALPGFKPAKAMVGLWRDIYYCYYRSLLYIAILHSQVDSLC